MTEPQTLPDDRTREIPPRIDGSEQSRPPQFRLRTITIIVAVIAIGLGWLTSLRTPNAGWLVIPAALWFAIFIGSRFKGSLAYRITLSALSFLGFIAVGAYVTVLTTFSLGSFEPRDLVEAIAPHVFVMLLPGVAVVVFLLIRGFVIALNSRE